MILSDKTLQDLVYKQGLVQVNDKFTSDQIQPGSIDCCLGNDFRIIEPDHIIQEFNKAVHYVRVEPNLEYNDGSVLIAPHQFMLATTEEYFKLPNNLTAFVEGRSSIGRMGLCVQNAGWVDPGFEGKITLELYNESPNYIRLTPGQRVCQMVFAYLDQECVNPYNGKYQKQNTTTGSMLYLDKEFR